MSCFTMPVISGSKMYIAYGCQRRINRVSIIGVSRKQRGSANMCLGFAYVNCEINEDKHAAIDVSLDKTEHAMRSYGLLLSFEQDKKFQHRHAIVYHDLDVRDIMFEKGCQTYRRSVSMLMYWKIKTICDYFKSFIKNCHLLYMSSWKSLST